MREYPADNLPEHAAAVPDLADEVALRQWLTSALATLTARERTVIVLRYLFDLPEAAVARDLGVTQGTVKSTSSRALAKLRVSADGEATKPASVIGGGAVMTDLDTLRRALRADDPGYTASPLDLASITARGRRLRTRRRLAVAAAGACAAAGVAAVLTTVSYVTGPAAPAPAQPPGHHARSSPAPRPARSQAGQPIPVPASPSASPLASVTSTPPPPAAMPTPAATLTQPRAAAPAPSATR